MMKYKGCGGSTTMIKNKCKSPPPPPAKSKYFLSVSITSKKSKAFSESTPKVRIKIPKLLVKMTAVKKKKKKHHGNNCDPQKLSVRHKKTVFPIKIASLFPNVISSKKSSSSCYPVRKKDYSCTKNNAKECMSRRVLVIEDKSNKVFMKTAVEEESALVTSKISLKPCEHPPFLTSLEIGCLKEEKTSKRTGLITTFKLHPRMKFSIKSMLNRRTGLKFTRGKRNAATCKGKSNGHNSTVRDVEAKERVHGAGEDEESDCQLELCKKRILMGERCRPMNFGGILQ